MFSGGNFTVTVVHDFSSLGAIVAEVFERLGYAARIENAARASRSINTELAQSDPRPALQDATALGSEAPEANSAAPAELAPRPKRGRPKNAEKAAAAAAAERPAAPAIPSIEPYAPAAQAAAPAQPVDAPAAGSGGTAATSVAVPAQGAAPAPKLSLVPPAAVPQAALTGSDGATLTSDEIKVFKSWVVDVFVKECGEDEYVRIHSEHGNPSAHIASVAAMRALRESLEARLSGKPAPTKPASNLAGF